MPLNCQSEFSGFGKANFNLNNSPRSHTFHITLNWNRNVYLYPHGLLKDLGLNLLYDVIFKFFIKWLFLTYNFLRSQTPKYILWVCCDWESCYRFVFYFIYIGQFKLYCKRDYTHFDKDIDRRYQYRSCF